jgi:hypothetical protein
MEMPKSGASGIGSKQPHGAAPDPKEKVKSSRPSAPIHSSQPTSTGARVESTGNRSGGEKSGGPESKPHEQKKPPPPDKPTAAASHKSVEPKVAEKPPEPSSSSSTTALSGVLFMDLTPARARLELLTALDRTLGVIRREQLPPAEIDRFRWLAQDFLTRTRSTHSSGPHRRPTPDPTAGPSTERRRPKEKKEKREKKPRDDKPPKHHREKDERRRGPKGHN